MRNLRKPVLFIFLMSFWINGQNLSPPIYNYGQLDYGGGSKNWGLAVNEEGELFVANNNGLLYFNGEHWILNRLPNGTVIRSVATVDNRIYTGSYEEFGYWNKDSLGKLQYTSLTHLIKDHSFTSEEFWEIIPNGDKVFFHSFSTVYQYDYQKDEVQVIRPGILVSDIITYKERIILAGGIQGLFELKDGQVVPLGHQSILEGTTITDMIVFHENLLIGTKRHGCYLFDGKELRTWDIPIIGDLKMHQLNKLLVLDNGKIAMGTIKNGVYLYDAQNQETQILNRESGLQNNTILSILQFQDQLWLGLDNGMARIKLNNAITYYSDQTGTLGMVYDLAFHSGKLYLGSNTGAFYFEEGRLKFLNGLQGHVWDLQKIEGDLLCGHNTGTYRIGSETFEKISSITGGYEIIKIPETQATYMQGTYTGLAKFKKKPEGDWQVTRVEGITFPIKQLCFESQRVLWAAHPYKGYYRIQLDANCDTATQIQEFVGKDAPDPYNIKIYKIKNQIVLYGKGTWYRYDPIADRIVPFGDFQDYNNKELLFFDEDQYWFVDGEKRKEITLTDLKTDSLLITDLPLRKRLAPESHRIIKINDSISFLTLSDGYARINRSKFQKQVNALPLPLPKLYSIKDEKEFHKPNQSPIQIPYKNAQSITLEIAAPELIQPRYFCTLVGPKEYTFHTDDGTVNFQNLPHGDYEFQAATMGMDNKTSQNFLKVPFQIAPPWFLSKWSIGMYTILAISVLFIIRWYNRKKLKRKQSVFERKMKKEQEERILAMEKEKLEKEIRQKQKELARTTMDMVKKNELISELKEMLVLHKNEFSNKHRYRSLSKKLDRSINGDEDWKHFEVSFKELHEDFFDNLLREFPNLTPKDLKLCAYLKMNLSSKEIAPLMGISIRGVEIHRYRLRKKLFMDSAQNLSNYLIKFH